MADEANTLTVTVSFSEAADSGALDTAAEAESPSANEQAKEQRIDAFLAAAQPERSRSTWAGYIQKGRVEVNGELCKKASFKVTDGDTITIQLPNSTLPPAPDIPVLYEDDAIVIYNKPAGLLTHAKGGDIAEHTLSSIHAAKYNLQDVEREGIIHRLDRSTSGVIVMAKTATAQKDIQAQFQDRKTAKYYVAITSGSIDEPSQINLPIRRNPKSPQFFMAHELGKPAQTLLDPFKHSPEGEKPSWTAVLLRPKTGRTHQLRVHTAHIGHAIIGDNFYSDAAYGADLLLHAYMLKLSVNGEMISVQATLPNSFDGYINDGEVVTTIQSLEGNS